MSTSSYQNLALRWHPNGNSNKLFGIFLVCTLIFSMLLGLWVDSIEVPKQDSRIKAKIPERVAKFILEKPKPKPKPKPVVLPKPKPKPQPKPKPTVKRKPPKKDIVLTQDQQKARDKAADSGLLALSEEFADLIDTSSIDSMVGKNLKRASSSATVAQVSTNAITEGAGKGSGGVSVGSTLANNSGGTTLDPNQISVAKQLLIARAAKAKVERVKDAAEQSTKRTGNYRPEEDIAYVMDKNKSKLHSLYRRARRSDSSIQGKIVLDITIAPDGTVLKVVMLSSELNNPKLESRIISRIRQFKFGAANVKKVTVTYPIEFLPS